MLGGVTLELLTLRVLVLDDHAFQRAYARVILEGLGIEAIIEAQDGQEALDKLNQCGGVDIVLCDLRMPGMDGVTFLSLAKQADLIGAIILSSNVDLNLRTAVKNFVHKLNISFLGDVGKPYSKDTLHELISCYRRDIADNPPASQISIDTLDVEGALINNEVKAYYQPKFDISTGECIGAEVLARWHHPKLGVLSPNVFLPKIKALKLFGEMFYKIFEQGLSLQVNKPGIILSYNLDSSQMSSPDLPASIHDKLNKYNVPASNVIFEITETNAIEMQAQSLENGIRLRLMGCGLSMDDFGTGYSSLGRLCDLPFDQIKLDGSFMHSLYPGSHSYASIASAVSLTRALGISLVVEGVETAQQCDYLLELGCSQAQGFLFSRPMPAEDFISKGHISLYHR
jgi:EAL domain-containing protein (putative c-di-GMP-specific phosphodiesterase class I)